VEIYLLKDGLELHHVFLLLLFSLFLTLFSFFGFLAFISFSLSFSFLKQKKNGSTLLHLACDDGREDLALRLLQKPGIDIVEGDKEGDTPLHIACMHGLTDVVERLVEMPSLQINKKNLDGETPIHLALQNYHYQEGLILLKVKGIDVNLVSFSSSSSIIPWFLLTFFLKAGQTGNPPYPHCLL